VANSPDGGPGPRADVDSLLQRMRDERGYALSYHEILARTDPRLLEAYQVLYARFTLDGRHLDARRRELVWTALLTVSNEHVGSLHLERAVAAGATADELRAAIALAGVTAAWDQMAFAHQHWSALLGGSDFSSEYRRLVDAAAAELEQSETELILLVCAAARRSEGQYLDQLARCYAAQLPEEEMAEAVSYLLLPNGANALLWATDLWLDALASGAVAAGEALAGVSFDVRRA